MRRLCEAVAQNQHEGNSSAGVGNGQTLRNRDCVHLQELLASVEGAGDTDRDDDCVAEKSRVDRRPRFFRSRLDPAEQVSHVPSNGDRNRTCC